MFIVSARFFRSLVRTTAITYSFSLPLIAQSSLAIETKISNLQPPSAIIYYDLPVLPLGQALLEFSLQSGLSIIVQQGKVAGFNSSPIISFYLSG